MEGEHCPVVATEQTAKVESEGHHRYCFGIKLIRTAPTKGTQISPKRSESLGTVILRVRSRQVWRTLLIESDLMEREPCAPACGLKFLSTAKPRFFQIAIFPLLWELGA